MKEKEEAARMERALADPETMKALQSLAGHVMQDTHQQQIGKGIANDNSGSAYRSVEQDKPCRPVCRPQHRRPRNSRTGAEAEADKRSLYSKVIIKSGTMDAATARNLPICQLLASWGFAPVKGNERDKWFISPFRQETTASFHVNVPKNIWYDHGEGEGGNALDLAARLLGHPKDDISPTLSWLTREYTGQVITPIPRKVSLKQPEVIIKAVEPIGHTLRLYLTRERGIDEWIGRQYLSQVRFTNHGREYYALGFRNNLLGYELRNKYWKGSSSTKAISSIVGENTGRVFCFEGFCDALSLLTILKSPKVDGDLLVLNGTGLRERAMDYIRSRGYSEVKTFFDNGKGGAATTEYFQQELPGKVQPQNRMYQEFDDLNDYLTKGRGKAR